MVRFPGEGRRRQDIPTQVQDLALDGLGTDIQADHEQ